MITLRVPYPMGFYAKGFDGRIDDPNAGWKGRGLWTTSGDREINWSCVTLAIKDRLAGPVNFRAASLKRDVSFSVNIAESFEVGETMWIRRLSKDEDVSNLLICYPICQAKTFHMMEGRDDHPGVTLPLLPRDRYRPAWRVV